MPDLSQRLKDALSDRYRIERELGRGGMATVFLAEDLKHRRRVAIKVLDPEVAAAIGPERFLREIETVAKLGHPHVLTLHDSGQAAGLLFFVMPYVTGESLRQRLERDKQLPLEDALQITREVADALDHAHRQGVIHRDIKPENILLEEGHALVADFGIARAVAAAGGEKLTATGVVVGTPAYMSPEQAGGSSRLDGRSDQYSLGCVLYEMLAGQPPFTGPTVESLVHQHLSVTPHPVTAVRASAPLAVERALARALAKTPADRYATPGEFAAALTAEVEPLPTPRTPSGRWWAVPIAAVMGTLLAVAVWQAWWPFGGPGGPPAAKKDWILVAEFDGPPGDSTLAPAARSLLSAALDQSKIVATVQQDQITEALRNAGKPAGIRLTPIVAKELAYRSAVRAVLEGTIGKLGTGYSIVVRLVDTDTARVLFTGSATAKGDDALIQTLGELAKKLRRGLGENRRALAATRPMMQAATPSFAAYRLFVQAMRRQGEGEWTDAIALHRQALALDPDFAMAWGEMSWCFQWRSTYDSVRVCIAEALRRPDRLTSVQRQLLEIRLAGNEGDYRRALMATEQLERQDPANISVLDGSWELLNYGHGRYKQALEWERRAMELSPFGPTEEMRIHEIWDLVGLGRFDEARASQRHLTGKWKTWVSLGIELGDGHFAVAESIATVHLDEPEMTREWPIGYRTFLFGAQAGRGAVEAAAVTLDQSMAIARAGDPGFQFADQVHQGLIMDLVGQMTLSSLSRGAVPLPPDTCVRDNSTESLLTRGLRAAFAGDGPAARRILAAARARPQRELRMNGASTELIEARAGLQAGRPEDAVRLLRPIAVREVEPWPQVVPVGLTWVRWTLADAFEQMGRLDSAAAYLERSASSPLSDWPTPYLHQRLALLDGRMGRVADAERHLAAAEKAWDRPDPAIRRLLEEARTVVRASRGIARPERAGS